MHAIESKTSSDWKVSERIASLNPQPVDCRGEFRSAVNCDTTDLTPFSLTRYHRPDPVQPDTTDLTPFSLTPFSRPVQPPRSAATFSRHRSVVQ